MSSESPEGVPQPAQPFLQPQSFPQAQPYPQQPYQQGQPYPQQPYPPQSYPQQPSAPYAGIPAAPPQPLRLNGGVAIATLVLSGLYVVLCVVEIFLLNNRVSLANRIMNDPGSVTLDQANSADSSVNDMSLVALLVFLSAIVLISVWQRSLRKVLMPLGQYDAVLKQSGYQIFRAAWIASIFLSIFLRGSGALDTPQDAISHDHKYMFYFGLRALLGVLLVYLALRLKRVSERMVTLARTGYSAAAVSYLGN